MSYSFHVRGATKADATEALVTKLDQTVQEQPVHAKDRDAIEANARAVIGLMHEPGEGVDLVVSCNGYITWDGELPEDPAELTAQGANISCYAHFIARDLMADGSGKPLEPAGI